MPEPGLSSAAALSAQGLQRGVLSGGARHFVFTKPFETNGQMPCTNSVARHPPLPHYTAAKGFGPGLPAPGAVVRGTYAHGVTCYPWLQGDFLQGGWHHFSVTEQETLTLAFLQGRTNGTFQRSGYEGAVGRPGFPAEPRGLGQRA